MKVRSEVIVGSVLGGLIVAVLARGTTFMDTIDLVGTVQASNATDVRPQIAGRLVRIAFEEGKPLKQGDLIAVIASRGNAAIGAGQATLDEERALQEYTTVIAPFDGIAGLREASVGDLVEPDGPQGIVLLTQVQPASVVFDLPAARVTEVRAALADHSVSAEAWDQRNEQLLDTGTLQAIDNEVSQLSGQVRLKAVFPNSDLRLWPGSVVQIHLQLSTARPRGPE